MSRERTRVHNGYHHTFTRMRAKIYDQEGRLISYRAGQTSKKLTTAALVTHGTTDDLARWQHINLARDEPGGSFVTSLNDTGRSRLAYKRQEYAKRRRYEVPGYGIIGSDNILWTRCVDVMIRDYMEVGEWRILTFVSAFGRSDVKVTRLHNVRLRNELY